MEDLRNILKGIEVMSVIALAFVAIFALCYLAFVLLPWSLIPVFFVFAWVIGDTARLE